MAAAMIVLVAVVAGCSDLGKTLRPLAVAQVAPLALDFGTIAPGDTAILQAELTNAGRDGLSGSVSSTAPEFIVSSGGGSFTLAPGDTLTVTVRFVPQSQGTFIGSLAFGSGNPSVALTGICQDPAAGSACEVVPASLSYGTVTLGQSATQDFVIRSVGTAPLGVDVVSSCPEFQVTAGGGLASIVSGDSLVVSVLFAPTSIGASNCTVTVGPRCPGVSVSGTGAAATLSFSADIQPIFTASCATSGCHSGASPAARLNLSAGVSYGQTVNVVSFAYNPDLRVAPNDLAGSVLYGKITNSGVYGGPMPRTQLLTSAQINKFAAWILEGAQNN